MLDAALFTDNLSCGVIAHHKDDAEEFFSNKLKFAYQNLPELIKRDREIIRETTSLMKFSNGSSIRVGTSLRSGTFQFLHISEHGKLCAKYPDKAEEVRTGALNTVQAGQIIFIESTAEGNSGDFYDICMNSMRKTELTPLDFKFHFYSWWEVDKYQLDYDVPVPERLQRYFHELEKEIGRKIPRKHKNWYVKKEEIQKDKMKQEFPSTPKEAFDSSIEGAIFHRQMAYLREQRRITKVPHNPSLPVYTFWDIGRDTTAIWFFQEVMRQFHFIDYFQNANEDLAYYAHVLRTRNLEKGIGYNYGTVYLPHDGSRKTVVSNALTPKAVLQDLGFMDVILVPRTTSKFHHSIDNARRILPLCFFDAEMCAEGIECLDNYRFQKDDKLQTFKPTPLHDKFSHGADAFQTFSDGYRSQWQEEEEERYRVERSYSGRNATTGY